LIQVHRELQRAVAEILTEVGAENGDADAAATTPWPRSNPYGPPAPTAHRSM
jgi:hypothetical protein